MLSVLSVLLSVLGHLNNHLLYVRRRVALAWSNDWDELAQTC